MSNVYAEEHMGLLGKTVYWPCPLDRPITSLTIFRAKVIAIRFEYNSSGNLFHTLDVGPVGYVSVSNYLDGDKEPIVTWRDRTRPGGLPAGRLELGVNCYLSPEEAIAVAEKEVLDTIKKRIDLLKTFVSTPEADYDYTFDS